MKTGLVLEGGALRAIFSAGVCDGLLDLGLMTDYFVGVSAGAAYGVSYLSKQNRRNLEVVTTYAPDRRYMGWGNLLDRKNSSYFGLEFAFDTIPNELIPFDYAALAAYPGQAEAVVTNLSTGKADYLPIPRNDPKGIVIQATCAMPLLFPTYHINGQPYLDGGIGDGIPWKRALDQGCDRVVVVLTRPRDYQRKGEALLPLMKLKYRDYPNFVAALEDRAQRYNADRAELFAMEKTGKVLVLAPESTLGVSRTERDTEKLMRLWLAGYQMAKARGTELKAFLGGEDR